MIQMQHEIGCMSWNFSAWLAASTQITTTVTSMWNWPFADSSRSCWSGFLRVQTARKTSLMRQWECLMEISICNWATLRMTKTLTPSEVSFCLSLVMCSAASTLTCTTKDSKSVCQEICQTTRTARSISAYASTFFWLLPNLPRLMPSSKTWSERSSRSAQRTCLLYIYLSCNDSHRKVVLLQRTWTHTPQAKWVSKPLRLSSIASIATLRSKTSTFAKEKFRECWPVHDTFSTIQDCYLLSQYTKVIQRQWISSQVNLRCRADLSLAKMRKFTLLHKHQTPKSLEAHSVRSL